MDTQAQPPGESSLVTLLRGTHQVIHPMKIRGRFTRLRTIGNTLLVGWLVLVPWTTFQGQQTLLFNIPGRKFVIFGAVFWPSDSELMIFILAAAAILLFFVTAIAGRVWCGYACPQTVFLHGAFFPIERWIEGGPAERRRREAKGWTFDRLWRLVLKHTIFVTIALVLGHTLVAYFYGARPLVDSVWHMEFSHPTAMGFALAFSAVAYWDFGFFRDQMCTYACPYARFQSALMDEDSLLVGYDAKRGDPRGKARAEGTGDCVDCGKCVAVCPTGIDIRDGTQMECIACARCIDACDSIMDRLNRPRGLVRYTTERILAEGESARPKLLRPRVLVYGGLLSILTFGLVVGIGNRDMIEMTILRPPGMPFTEMAGGQVNNHFTLRVLNKDLQSHALSFELQDLEEGELIVPHRPLQMKAGEVATMEIFIVAPTSVLQRGKKHFRIVAHTAQGEHQAAMSATLLGPRT